MGQQKYDAFKQSLREWMDAHPDEYAAFEAEMNRMDGAGYQRIMQQAVMLVPQYKKAIKRRMNGKGFEEVNDLETMIAEAGIGEKLMASFENADNTTIPAMICWLYYGRSFENMVEMGEELMAGAGMSRFQQFGFAMMTRFLVSRSISLGFRTRQDWAEYNILKKAIDSGQVTDWAVGTYREPAENRKRPGRKKIEMSLPQMFSDQVVIVLTDITVSMNGEMFLSYVTAMSNRLLGH